MAVVRCCSCAMFKVAVAHLDLLLLYVYCLLCIWRIELCISFDWVAYWYIGSCCCVCVCVRARACVYWDSYTVVYLSYLLLLLCNLQAALLLYDLYAAHVRYFMRRCVMGCYITFRDRAWIPINNMCVVYWNQIRWKIYTYILCILYNIYYIYIYIAPLYGSCYCVIYKLRIREVWHTVVFHDVYYIAPPYGGCC
jgi:hypothetical protein